jgi:hypothetical protein
MNCKKCFGRGFVWKMRGKTYTAVGCTRCGTGYGDGTGQEPQKEQDAKPTRAERP